MATKKQGFRTSAPAHSVAFLANVRKAEHLIAAGEYTLALQRLADAQDLEPLNQYLPTLIQRVTYLRNTAGHSTRMSTGAAPQPAAAPSGGESSLPRVSVPATVTPEGEGQSDHAIEARVKRLTIVATNLFERGSYESAFQTLVKAFLLAPTDPHVVECQKTLQPAIRLLKERGSVIGLDIVRGTPGQSVKRYGNVGVGEDEVQRADASGSPSLLLRQTHLSEVVPAVQEGRLEMLKQQKERERSERERAMWREASGPLKVYGQRIEGVGVDNETSSTRESMRRQTSFFAKLKQGKFLG